MNSMYIVVIFIISKDAGTYFTLEILVSNNFNLVIKMLIKYMRPGACVACLYPSLFLYPTHLSLERDGYSAPISSAYSPISVSSHTYWERGSCLAHLSFPNSIQFFSYDRDSYSAPLSPFL